MIHLLAETIAPAATAPPSGFTDNLVMAVSVFLNILLAVVLIVKAMSNKPEKVEIHPSPVVVEEAEKYVTKEMFEGFNETRMEALQEVKSQVQKVADKMGKLDVLDERTKGLEKSDNKILSDLQEIFERLNEHTKYGERLARLEGRRNQS